MATSSGTISSAGIGSGLDVTSIISSLMKVEQIPMTNLQTAASGLNTKLSAFGQVQSLVSSFRDAVTPLTNLTSYTQTTASSSDSTSVGASSTSAAVAGSYSIAVSSLATTQSTVSAAGQFAASTSTVGTGSITISLGQWNAGQTAFTPKTGATDITIPIGASENTLGAIRDKINAANAGVSATLITDTNGVRLALQSTSAGEQNGFKITVADDDGNNTDGAGLSQVAFDPSAGATLTTRTQAAANTQATINGIAVSTPGSTLTNVVDGLTFTLSKVTTTPVVVTVGKNTDSVKKMLGDFVNAYNGLQTFLASATKYNPDTKSGALLQGDALATGMQAQLRSVIGGGGNSSTLITSLSQVGIQFQQDGTLKLDDTKVAAAVANLPELSKALANKDPAAPSKNGLMLRVASMLDGMLSTGGTLPGKTASLQKQIASNTKDQQKLQDRIDATQARLQAQYSALDATMSNAKALSNYVTQQITTWNKSTG